MVLKVDNEMSGNMIDGPVENKQKQQPVHLFG